MQRKVNYKHLVFLHFSRNRSHQPTPNPHRNSHKFSRWVLNLQMFHCLCMRQALRPVPSTYQTESKSHDRCWQLFRVSQKTQELRKPNRSPLLFLVPETKSLICFFHYSVDYVSSVLADCICAKRLVTVFMKKESKRLQKTARVCVLCDLRSFIYANRYLCISEL